MASDDQDGAETERKRDDRRYMELLQELRVAQTGVQFLFAFLLTLAFTQRFAQVTEFQKWLYIGTLIATALASALLIGPVPLHRILFRRGLRPLLIRGTDLMARGGLSLLLVAINGAVLLILDVVVGGVWAAIMGAFTTAWFLFVWVVAPMAARRAGE